MAVIALVAVMNRMRCRFFMALLPLKSIEAVTAKWLTVRRRLSDRGAERLFCEGLLGKVRMEATSDGRFSHQFG
jgi:hypothetical protein